MKKEKGKNGRVDDKEKKVKNNKKSQWNKREKGNKEKGQIEVVDIVEENNK